MFKLTNLILFCKYTLILDLMPEKIGTWQKTAQRTSDSFFSDFFSQRFSKYDCKKFMNSSLACTVMGKSKYQH